MENENSDLAEVIIDKLAKDHDLNITIISAKPIPKEQSNDKSKME